MWGRPNMYELSRGVGVGRRLRGMVTDPGRERTSGAWPCCLPSLRATHPVCPVPHPHSSCCPPCYSLPSTPPIVTFHSSKTVFRNTVHSSFNIEMSGLPSVSRPHCSPQEPAMPLGLGEAPATGSHRCSTFLLWSTENGQRNHFLYFSYRICLCPSRRGS